MCGCDMETRHVCNWHAGRIRGMADDAGRECAESQFSRWKCEVVLGPAPTETP